MGSNCAPHYKPQQQHPCLLRHCLFCNWALLRIYCVFRCWGLRGKNFSPLIESFQLHCSKIVLLCQHLKPATVGESEPSVFSFWLGREPRPTVPLSSGDGSRFCRDLDLETLFFLESYVPLVGFPNKLVKPVLMGCLPQPGCDSAPLQMRRCVQVRHVQYASDSRVLISSRTAVYRVCVSNNPL